MSGTNGTKRVRGRALQRRRALALKVLGINCAICGTPVDPTAHWRHPDSYQLDHRIPLARGGSDTPDNWQVTHRRCNATKGAHVHVDPHRAYMHDYYPGPSRQW